MILNKLKAACIIALVVSVFLFARGVGEGHALEGVKSAIVVFLATPLIFLLLWVCPLAFKSLEARKKFHFRQIDSLANGYEFESYVADVLAAAGFLQVTVTKASGDYGVDITAFRLGLKYGIQCKLYTGSVGNKAVQEIAAGLAYYRCDIGIVVTNSVFTPSAVKLAEANHILLWDGERLGALIDTANRGTCSRH